MIDDNNDVVVAVVGGGGGGIQICGQPTDLYFTLDRNVQAFSAGDFLTRLPLPVAFFLSVVGCQLSEMTTTSC